DELNEIDEKSDGDYEIPDIPGSGLWCKEFSITLGVPATSVLKAVKFLKGVGITPELVSQKYY
uniref:hypothetical protein n=1 Tax=Okeania sp. SIO2F4 TaxID=2607790 RepID=UPI0025F9223D